MRRACRWRSCGPHLQGSRFLHLEPVPRATATVGGILAFRDDAFKTHFASVREVGRAVAFDMLGICGECWLRIRLITTSRARTWRWRRMRRYGELSRGAERSSPRQFFSDCTIAMCGYHFREGHRCTCPWICRTCSRQRRACGERLAIGETLPRGRLEPLVKALRAAYFFKGTAEPRLPNISVPAGPAAGVEK